MGKNINENISKYITGKNSQNLLDHAKKSATDSLKIASKRAIRKTAKATGDLPGKRIADNYKNSARKRSIYVFTSRWKLNRNNKRKIHITKKIVD